MKQIVAVFLVALALFACLCPAYAAEVEISLTMLEDDYLPDIAGNSFRVLPDGSLLIAGNARGMAEASDRGSLMLGLDPDNTVQSKALHNWEAGEGYFRGIAEFSDGPLITNNMVFAMNGEEAAFYDVLTTLRDGQVLAEQATENDQISVYQGKDCALVSGTAKKTKDKHSGKFYVYYLTAMNQAFETLWRKEFTDEEFRIQGVAHAPDGYFAYGLVEEQETGRRNSLPAVMKLTDTGDIIWSNHIMSSYIAFYTDAVLLADGGLLAVGQYTMEEAAATDAAAHYVGIATRYAADGEILWHREYDSTSTGMLFAIEPYADGFLAAGAVNSHAARSEIFLTHLNDAGNVLQTWTLRDARVEAFREPVNMLATPSGYCIVSRVSLAEREDELQRACIIRFEREALEAENAA